MTATKEKTVNNTDLQKQYDELWEEYLETESKYLKKLTIYREKNKELEIRCKTMLSEIAHFQRLYSISQNDLQYYKHQRTAQKYKDFIKNTVIVLLSIILILT